jgi:hypothetical protein
MLQRTRSYGKKADQKRQNRQEARVRRVSVSVSVSVSVNMSMSMKHDLHVGNQSTI